MAGVLIHYLLLLINYFLSKLIKFSHYNTLSFITPFGRLIRINYQTNSNTQHIIGVLHLDYVSETVIIWIKTELSIPLSARVSCVSALTSKSNSRHQPELPAWTDQRNPNVCGSFFRKSLNTTKNTDSSRNRVTVWFNIQFLMLTMHKSFNRFLIHMHAFTQLLVFPISWL